MVDKKKRILFGASYSVSEPLGLLHLAGLARDLGWERRFNLVKNHNFEPFFEEVRAFKPDVVGFNVYTGNHLQLQEAFRRLKRDFPRIAIVAGGPHATYFPAETLNFADYVVMSEGFTALKKILTGEVRPGIIPLQDEARFPHPDRETFYAQYPEHGRSRIKSVITMTGCPFLCSYCYNASKPENIVGNLPPQVARDLIAKLGPKGRLFPKNVRSVDDVIAEGREIREKWPTEVIYFQDDVHGFDTAHWMPEFAKRWPKEVGLPYHAQIRWEMTRDKKRLDLFQEGGCFGLTLAIEAANPIIRSEVLNRLMPTEIIFTGMREIIERGMRVRSEQISGLPYGATRKRTPINLKADLELVELNVRLREETGGPTMAWLSTLAPYKGTNMGEYCARNGFYNGDSSDVPDTFFERSVMRFLKQWVGPNLEKVKDNPDVWLNHQELERYRNQNAELRRIFNFVTMVPKGHELATAYLQSEEPFSYERLGRETELHLQRLSAINPEAAHILENIQRINAQINSMQIHDRNLSKDIHSLASYFACIPKGNLAVERAIQYARMRGDSRLDRVELSTAIRHHLYDNVLYETSSLDTKKAV
jgi:radical SAM superfamily enzyme YgiQ (UPF0313 family)